MLAHVMILAALGTLATCATESPPDSTPRELMPMPIGIAPHATQPAANYDPLALALATGDEQQNPDPGVPPSCYTRTEAGANSCASCHTASTYPNMANDWELQQNFPFFELSTNHWKNQFRDRTAIIERFSDKDVLDYVRTDNYEPLRRVIANRDFPGWKPDLSFARGFDAQGFANDGTAWRALRYKPFAGPFWPAQGSTDDAFIRLPLAFRVDASGAPSREIYRINLSILEAAITAGTADQPTREVERLDEAIAGLDLDGDGRLGETSKIIGLPSHFVGGASHIAVTRSLYPEGVELLHTVRYLDPDAPAYIATRVKEVRYATKAAFLGERALAKAHRAVEDPTAGPDGDPLRGYRNALGWQLQGWIEDANGWLRLQTHEEHQFCTGCHSNLGIAVDQTFSFPRKVPGAEGWAPQDPRRIPDVPARGETEPEFATFLARTGSDTPFYPSRERAIELDRAYLANVLEQSYVWGRDAIASPVTTAHATIDERSTNLGETDRVRREGSLLLQWPAR